MGSPARALHIRHLSSGGLVTNYYCTCRCAHGRYCCSPHWAKRYSDAGHQPLGHVFDDGWDEALSGAV